MPTHLELRKCETTFDPLAIDFPDACVASAATFKIGSIGHLGFQFGVGLEILELVSVYGATESQRVATFSIEIFQQIHHENEAFAIHSFNPDVVGVTGEDRGVDRSDMFLVALFDIFERREVNVDALALDHLVE